jgi:acetyltransferase EpsM
VTSAPPVAAGRLVILGAGEHARVVAEAARAAGWKAIDHVEAAGEAALAARLAEGEASAPDAATLPGAATAPAAPVSIVLGFGVDLAARRRAASRFGPGAPWATVIHPAAWVAPSARIEPGTVVLAGAIVNTGAHLGPHVIVNSGAIVEHDVELGAHVHVAPGATVGGGTRIGDGAFIGLGSAVRDHLAVGPDATVGMGAVVVADVPAGSTVVGVPARVRDQAGDRPR